MQNQMNAMSCNMVQNSKHHSSMSEPPLSSMGNHFYFLRYFFLSFFQMVLQSILNVGNEKDH